MIMKAFDYVDSSVVWLNSKGLSRLWLVRLIMFGTMYYLIDRITDSDVSGMLRVIDTLNLVFIIFWVCCDEILNGRNVDIANAQKVVTRTSTFAIFFYAILGFLAIFLVITALILGKYVQAVLHINYYAFFVYFYSLTPKEPPHKYSFKFFKTSEA